MQKYTLTYHDNRFFTGFNWFQEYLINRAPSFHYEMLKSERWHGLARLPTFFSLLLCVLSDVLYHDWDQILFHWSRSCQYTPHAQLLTGLPWQLMLSQGRHSTYHAILSSLYPPSLTRNEKISKILLHRLCRWLQLAQLAKGKKSRP